MIYTLTFQGVLNYGAVLQAYALQKFLINLGYSTEIVDYRPGYFSWQVYRPAKGLIKTMKKYKRLIHFSNFRRTHLRITGAKVRRSSDLAKLPEAHAFVCGSDQIWNEKITGGKVDPVFVLDVDSASKKIAYAASTGGHKISNQPEEVLDRIRRFQSIGTRESFLKSDIECFNSWSSIEHVVDPTLLINDYSDLLAKGKSPAGRYIASYEVSDDASRQVFNLAIQKLKELTNLPVYHLGSKPIPSADYLLDTVSPCDWLATLYNAELVCTNSFHGTAFALNFNKSLISVSHVDAEKNARVVSLLEKGDLMSRYFRDLEELSLDRIYLEYNKNKLNEFVNHSQGFLVKALGSLPI